MAGKEVKVFGLYASAFSLRVEIALRLKGVEYEYVEEDLSNKSPLLLIYNPVHKKIPVLLHNGKPISESMVILEYIDETWKQNPILPQDPYERAMARFWAKFVDEKCTMQVWTSLWKQGDDREKVMKEAVESLMTLEGALHGKKFFGGDAVGLVDIAGIILAYWVPLAQELVGTVVFDGEKFPILNRWAESLISADVVKECLPDREKLYAFYESRKEAYMMKFKETK